jgi:hypothetical protein
MIFSDNVETPDVLIMSYHLLTKYNYLISYFMLMLIIALMQIEKKSCKVNNYGFFFEAIFSVQVSREISCNN